MLKSFIGALPLVAKILGDKFGVRVRIAGNIAFTDGNLINIPCLPDTEEAQLLGRGYIDHESAHVRFTDFVYMKTSGLFKTLINVIEDARVERLIGEKYPGCKINLKKLAEHLLAKGSFSPGTDNPQEVFLSWISAVSRTQIGHDFNSLSCCVATKVEEILGTNTFLKMKNLLQEIPSLSSTEEARNLAQKLLDLLEEEKDRREQQEESYQPENQDTESGEEDSGVSDLDSGADGADEGTNHSIPGETNPDQEIKPSSVLEQILEEAVDGFETISEILEKELSDASASEKNAFSVPAEVPINLGPIDAEEVRRNTVQLRARLAGLVQASKLKRSLPRRVGYRLDTRVLFRMGISDPRIFQSRAEKVDVNTAVVVLVDRSSSMDGQPIKVAAQTAFAAADVMSGIKGMTCSVVAFPVRESTQSATMNDGVGVILPFGERPDKGRFMMNAYGGTPLAEAMNWCGVALLRRPEPRKILLVATDGEPDDLPKALKSVQGLKLEGIELLGLGISNSSVSQIFDQYRIISQVGELPRALLEMLQERLCANKVAA